MKVQFHLGEFRSKKDEKNLSVAERVAHLKGSMGMHSSINYGVVIPELQAKYDAAKPKYKASILAVLNIAKQQQAAGYGK